MKNDVRLGARTWPTAARARPRSAPPWLILLLCAQCSTAAMALPPGNYEIFSQTVMPHLDEMRRITAVESRCVGDDVSALFPVLRQPALRGCVLQRRSSDEAQIFDLVCQTALVATGNATVTIAPKRIKGDLSIKMGGKNMTFTQHVRAVPRGPCAAGDMQSTLRR